MAINQLPNGKWLLVKSMRPKGVPGNPVTLRRVFDSKAAARRSENQMVLDLHERLTRKNVPTWNQVFDLYIGEQTENLAKVTLYSIQKCLDKYIGHLNEKRIDEITFQDMSDIFAVKLKDKALSHKQYVSRKFRAVFEFAIQRRFIKENPAPVIKFKAKNKIQACLSEAEAGLLLTKARDADFELYPIWAMALYTGMRNGELFALKWSNVDLDRKLIRVTEAWNRKDGFKSTKSGNDRNIEISDALLPVLQELKLKGEWGDFVLPRLRSWERGEQAKDLRNFLAAIGLHAVRFHDLRATWATILLAKGVEPIKVMMMGGWADLETLMIYVRKSGIDIKGAAAKLSLHDHHRQSATIIPIGL